MSENGHGTLEALAQLAPALRFGHVVNGDGEAEVTCLGCHEKDKRLTTAYAKISELRNELAGEHAEEGVAADVREVLEYWRPLCMPRAKIVVKSERWLKVRARLTDKDVATRKPAYTVLSLKAAVVGALMSESHVENGWLDAKTIFRDSTTVDQHIARLVAFKERQGVSALELVDRLAGPHLAWLADRCNECGELRVTHLMPGGVRDEGGGLRCARFDESWVELERWKRGQEARA